MSLGSAIILVCLTLGLQGHIPGAVNVPLGTLLRDADNTDSDLRRSLLDGKQSIVVYCKSGFRAGLAAEELLSVGFVHTYNLEGGYKAWAQRKQQQP